MPISKSEFSRHRFLRDWVHCYHHFLALLGTTWTCLLCTFSVLPQLLVRQHWRLSARIPLREALEPSISTKTPGFSYWEWYLDGNQGLGRMCAHHHQIHLLLEPPSRWSWGYSNRHITSLILYCSVWPWRTIPEYTWRIHRHAKSYLNLWRTE